MAARVLIVLRGRWPRALLRAQLRERGYDAVAAPSLAAALPYVSGPRGVFPRLILVEGELLGQEDAAERLAQLSDGVSPAVVLLRQGEGAVPEGDWTAVLPRSLPHDELLRTVTRLVPAQEAAD